MLKRSPDNLDEFDNQIEIGGNYFELIEFTLIRQTAQGEKIHGTYGINVAKVREVVQMPKINSLASRVPGIAGIFELRGIPIPAVNLCSVLGDQYSSVSDDQQIIVTEFSHKRAGFIVHATNRIRRVTWDKVLPPATDSTSSITGMMLIEDNEFLFILDLETIIAVLEGMAHGSPAGENPANYRQPIQSQAQFAAPATGLGVLLVDDSNLILSNLSKALTQAGFSVVLARDGLEAVSILEESGPHGSIQAIVTDIEMPQMDGITMVTRVRANPKFGSMPIYLHSSLGDMGSKALAEKAGANGYFVKNDVTTIIETLKKHRVGHKITG